ncbi:MULTISPECIES: helix-turn-helix domain-containing protein [Aminobacter]|uniref:Helix-turn-helix domain-containing protein n=2 Tax=Aminobacter TaxID=31988 RepID=A0AAC8YQB4_AMIAI|nr:MULTISPECIES: helix-turn-helix transcriptional regulator [Aminobacter]AMS42338.1 Helix-turn-helix domain-containing protein [Aminobacter aminovorans]MBA8906635.1 transcriptional regulator with XRE-family HTH domain [Aminobacter ciceronei]MBA9020239.1 transcriptional regulator with XRE-family HTH domain [Aminobacter ciceronei]MBB3709071.1 transcriptional regulator with XRE-family HTH domain [Aminobacter aminovorans]WMC94626.1 helix-turn-helix transcriptional regulator [Aminobacter aminovoran
MSDTTNIYEQTPDLDTIGGRLSRAREASGLSASELAWRLGVKTATINAWERDRSQPGAHRIAKLAGLLGTSISWILHGIGPAPREDDLSAASVSLQMERLLRLHRQTGNLIGQLERDLRKLESAGT